MIAFIIPILARWGIQDRFLKPLAWFLLIIAAGALCWLLWAFFVSWLHGREDDAVHLDQQKVNVEALSRTLDAERAATAEQDNADAAFANDQEQLHHEVETKANADPVGPGVRATLERLREQQHAAQGHNAAR